MVVVEEVVVVGGSVVVVTDVVVDEAQVVDVVGVGEVPGSGTEAVAVDAAVPPCKLVGTDALGGRTVGAVAVVDRDGPLVGVVGEPPGADTAWTGAATGRGCPVGPPDVPGGAAEMPEAPADQAAPPGI